MGGESFINTAWGKTAEEAFRKVVQQAQYDYGHAGYTGTIAEKVTFVMIPLPEHKDPIDFANDMINNDERVGDKWGDAGCTEIPVECEAELVKRETPSNSKSEGDKLFLFFGWASS